VLRHDAFKAKFAGMLKHSWTVRLDVLIKPYTGHGAPEKPREHLLPKQTPERCLSHHERLTPQVIPVQLDQIEGIKENGFIVVPVTDALERRYPIVIASNRFPIDNAGACVQANHRFDNQREPFGQVITGAAV
jgi:hypothetical protein